jgi:hypothetical protein
MCIIIVFERFYWLILNLNLNIFVFFRCKEWIQRMRREDLQKQDFARFYNGGYYLCANHFEESQFMNATQRNSLIWNAVPSIFSIPNPPPAVTPSRQLPTKRCLLPDHKPARKRRRHKLDFFFYAVQLSHLLSIL